MERESSVRTMDGLLYYASSSSSPSTNINLMSFSNANLTEKERDKCIRRLRRLARAVLGVAREDQRERGANTNREKEEKMRACSQRR